MSLRRLMMRLLWDSRIRFSLCSGVMSVVLAGCIGANAQLTAAAGGVSKPQSPAAATAVRNSSSRDSDSIISEDDVLDVYVMDIAELSRSEEHTSELQSLRHLVCR